MSSLALRTFALVTIAARLCAAAPDIRLAKGASIAEETAARELAEHIGTMTGATPQVRPEGTPATGPVLFVGHTRAAAQAGVDAAKLGPEQWIVRSANAGLLLVGGRPRGTLYAVYHYLEDIAGVRWWNPWEQTVPTRGKLPLEGISLRGEPTIKYRDIYQFFGRDGGRFAARNRANRDGDARISATYGGCRDYGPPYHVHTFYKYIPPRTYLETNPEWFSEIKGQRVAERHQLCLSNKKLREAFIEKLRAYILQSEAAAKAAGTPAPIVYDISQNDWLGQCQCATCQAIVKREGDSEAGLLLDFINEIADAIRPEFPYVYIDTLAYQYTQKPPKTVRPRDNVIIRLCDTRSNATFPITSEANTDFREFLLAWAKTARNLRIWDYAVTYARPRGLPYPSADTYADDFRFYAAHNVEGVFTELEFPVIADVRDYKVWMMTKLLENPSADAAIVQKEFTDGFYGAAGPLFRQYRANLRSSQNTHEAYIGMSPGASAFSFLDFDTVFASQKLFHEGEKGLVGNETLLRRWRHARLSLDRATCVRWRQLATDFQRKGKSMSNFPFKRKEIAARIRQTWTEQTKIRLAGVNREKSLVLLDQELTKYTALPEDLAPPSKFRDVPPERLFDFTADLTRNWKNIVKVVKDPETESGIANRLDFPSSGGAKHALEKYKLPMPWGLYIPKDKKFYTSAKITAKAVPGPGYHWYRFGAHKLEPSMYLYFFWSWIIQLDIDSARDLAEPDAKFDIWARIKFTGPAFPHGKQGDANSISVERVVLVKQAK